MENNFYVGDIYYGKRKQCYTEKVVLYTSDNVNYLDLISGKWYTTDSSKRDYVIKETIIPTDINEHRENYKYLLYKYNNKIKVKK